MNDTPSQLRILLADGQRFTQVIIANMLRSLGYHELTLASSGVQALTVMQDMTQPPPDLVILNQDLADFDGTTMLKMIRGGASGIPAETPVMILSNDSGREVVRDAFIARVNDFVMMPLSMATLGRRIARVRDEVKSREAA
jgi:PleD family two-component response regulator